jgi:hypothetical protein
MHMTLRNHAFDGLLSVVLAGAFVLTLGASVVRGAEIFRCDEWSNASLSHGGVVHVAIDKTTLAWRTDRASSTAQVVKISDGNAAYVDGAYLYQVFGVSFLEFGRDVMPPETPITIRRIPFVRAKPTISETQCQ